MKRKAEGKNTQGGVDIDEEGVKLKEVTIFVSFAIFLILCVYQQLNVGRDFETNHAISNWIHNSTFNSDIRGEITLDEIKMKEEYYKWLESFINKKLY